MSWTERKPAVHSLEGSRVAVAEDETVIALQVGYLLSEAGAYVVGPAGTVEEALELVKTGDLTAAVLDVRLGGETIERVADALTERHVPFVFYSGQMEHEAISRRWPNATFLPKPTPSNVLIDTVRKMSGRPSPSDA